MCPNPWRPPVCPVKIFGEPLESRGCTTIGDPLPHHLAPALATSALVGRPADRPGPIARPGRPAGPSESSGVLALGEGHRHLKLLVVANDRQSHLIVGRVLSHETGERGGLARHLAIDGGDDVALLQSGLLRG